MTPQVSIILPTLNEKDNILPLIRTIHQELKGFHYEIVVVDDKSSDGTAQVVLEAQDPKVKVIVQTGNHGYARSILEGIERSEADILILMDSDFNHRPQEIPQMLRGLQDYDFVSGSRFLPGGRMVPAWRGICSRGFNLFIRWVTGSRMTDHLYGFFALKRRLLGSTLKEDIFFGFGDYGIRLLFFLQKEKVRILELPSIYGQRLAGGGNNKLWAVFCRYFSQTLKLAGKGRIA